MKLDLGENKTSGQESLASQCETSGETQGGKALEKKSQSGWGSFGREDGYGFIYVERI